MIPFTDLFLFLLNAYGRFGDFIGPYLVDDGWIFPICYTWLIDVLWDPIFPYGIPYTYNWDNAYNGQIEFEWLEMCKNFHVYGRINSKLWYLWTSPDLSYLAWHPIHRVM